jgi:hypothetical protein
VFGKGVGAVTLALLPEVVFVLLMLLVLLFALAAFAFAFAEPALVVAEPESVVPPHATRTGTMSMSMRSNVPACFTFEPTYVSSFR